MTSTFRCLHGRRMDEPCPDCDYEPSSLPLAPEKVKELTDLAKQYCDIYYGAEEQA